MLGLRQKISLGFGALLVIILVIGVQSILHLSRLGGSIDVILRENYRSVIACQQMKEALERIDSGTLFVLLGDTRAGERPYPRQRGRVREGPCRSSSTTSPCPARARWPPSCRTSSAGISAVLRGVDDSGPARAISAARPISRSSCPLFGRSRTRPTTILQMNQQNMSDANDRARRERRPRPTADVRPSVRRDGAGRRLHLLHQEMDPPAHPPPHPVGGRDPARQPRPRRGQRLAGRDRAPVRGVQRHGRQPAGVPADRPGQAHAHPAGHPAGLRQPARRGGRRRPGGQGRGRDRIGPDRLRAEARRRASRTCRSGGWPISIDDARQERPRRATLEGGQVHPAIRPRRRALLPPRGGAHPGQRAADDRA